MDSGTADPRPCEGRPAQAGNSAAPRPPPSLEKIALPSPYFPPFPFPTLFTYFFSERMLLCLERLPFRPIIPFSSPFKRVELHLSLALNASLQPYPSPPIGGGVGGFWWVDGGISSPLCPACESPLEFVMESVPSGNAGPPRPAPWRKS